MRETGKKEIIIIKNRGKRLQLEWALKLADLNGPSIDPFSTAHDSKFSRTISFHRLSLVCWTAGEKKKKLNFTRLEYRIYDFY